MLCSYLAIAFAATATLAARCPPPGPVLPPPTATELVQFHDLTTALDSLSTANISKWNTSTTSFSIEITSANNTLFQHHHTAAIHPPNCTNEVGGNSIYRIASVTKVFNVLAILTNAPWSLDVSVADIVPELFGNAMYRPITVRMLASQLAAVPRDGFGFDMAIGADDLQQHGFPAVTFSPDCDVDGKPACDRAQFFRSLTSNNLTGLPGDRPAYSNLAYTILGYVLEELTGKPFAEVIRDSVTEPLGLRRTKFDLSDTSNIVVPAGPGEQMTGFDEGTYNATGGLYSTSAELSIFLRSILNHKFLSAAETHQWLKPLSFAGGLSAAVGMPWEIIRLSNVTPDRRTIDVYTKSGDLLGYSSFIVLIPDYQVAASILVASDNAHDPAVDLLDIVLEKLVPAMDQVARKQATHSYASTYKSCNGSLSLIIDDGPGLKIREWTSGGGSMLDTLASYAWQRPSEEMDFRLYPIGSQNRWRMVIEALDDKHYTSISRASQVCKMWFTVDQFRYAGQPVDEFIFKLDGDGRAATVTNPGLRSTLTENRVIKKKSKESQSLVYSCTLLPLLFGPLYCFQVLK